MILAAIFEAFFVARANWGCFHGEQSMQKLSATIWNSTLLYTINPLSRGWGEGAYLFQVHLRVGLIETRDYLREREFNLEMMMVSVLHKELEYKMEKLSRRSFRSCS